MCKKASYAATFVVHAARFGVLAATSDLVDEGRAYFADLFMGLVKSGVQTRSQIDDRMKAEGKLHKAQIEAYETGRLPIDDADGLAMDLRGYEGALFASAESMAQRGWLCWMVAALTCVAETGDRHYRDETHVRCTPDAVQLAAMKAVLAMVPMPSI